MRVAFLGPDGTFTEEALLASARQPVDKVSYPTVYETVMAVQNQACDRALVPIENSLEGAVTATLDTLASEADDVRIAGEVIHPIRHCLIAAGELEIGRVEKLFSHPQATAQCEHFLRSSLSHVERVSVASTAEAVRLVATMQSGPCAAIGSRLAAENYACSLLAEGIEDRTDNLTRFVWLAPTDATTSEQASKTSVVFWGFSDGSPGALVSVLEEFAKRNINLTKIESRPRRVRLGRYMFFADLEGGAQDPNVAEALVALDKRVETLRVLGSYPAAQLSCKYEPKLNK
jgi:prephenate dehydratase